MTIDANSFNFDAMKEAVGADPFAEEANKYGVDERFYTLSKDKEGNGAALIRFIPDSEKGMIQKLFSINTTIIKNGKKRFVSEYSPSSIGQPCPFQEEWQKLWNANDKEGAKVYGRGIRYITNIKVLKDPAKPENEGKIFLYAMSGKMKDKIQSAQSPSEQDLSLGATVKEMFNPLKGHSFKLVAKKGANGQINYDSSEVVNDATSIYDSVELAINDLKENSHPLSGLLNPESFMSYTELQDKMKWVNFAEQDHATVAPVTTEVAQATAQVSEVQPADPALIASTVSAVAGAVASVMPEVAVADAITAEPAKEENSLDDLLASL